jgi:hypothetical protein
MEIQIAQFTDQQLWDLIRDKSAIVQQAYQALELLDLLDRDDRDRLIDSWVISDPARYAKFLTDSVLFEELARRGR